jgi:hypothetical protein
MRAVTLLQPWASLVFRCKKHETRSTPFLRRAEGEVIIITASARFPSHNMISEDLHELCLDVFGCNYNHTLPLGAGLGTVSIGCTLSADLAAPADDADRISGDWSPNRYATALAMPQEWSGYIPVRGNLGLWRWPITMPVYLQAEGRADG